jgi:hypothetical protein
MHERVRERDCHTIYPDGHRLSASATLVERISHAILPAQIGDGLLGIVVEGVRIVWFGGTDPAFGGIVPGWGQGLIAGGGGEATDEQGEVGLTWNGLVPGDEEEVEAGDITDEAGWAVTVLTPAHVGEFQEHGSSLRMTRRRP